MGDLNFAIPVGAQIAAFGAAASYIANSAPLVSNRVDRAFVADRDNDRRQVVIAERRRMSERRHRPFLTRIRSRSIGSPHRKRLRVTSLAGISYIPVRTRVVNRSATPFRGMVHRSRSRFSRSRSRRAPKRRRRARSSNVSFGSTAGVKRRQKVLEARERSRSNRAPKMCRQLILIPSRCRDKLIISRQWKCSAISGHANEDVDQRVKTNGDVTSIPIVGHAFPLEFVSSIAYIAQSQCAGFKLLTTKYDKYAVHNMSVVVNIKLNTTAVPIRFVLQPTTAQGDILGNEIGEICDSANTTHVTMTGNQTQGSVHWTSLGAGINTAAIYGVRNTDVSSKPKFTSTGMTSITVPDSYPILRLYYAQSQAGVMPSDLDWHIMVTVVLDYEFSDPKPNAQIDN